MSTDFVFFFLVANKSNHVVFFFFSFLSPNTSFSL